MESVQLPLVLFTVFSQVAVGLVLMLTIQDYVFPAAVKEGSSKRFRFAGISVVFLVAISVIFSLFHLGKPLHAFKSFMNLGTSTLSLEILAMFVVGIIALFYSFLWWKSPNGALRKVVGLVLSICGIAAVTISSRAYALPSKPSWDSWQTTAAFLLTAVLIGAVILSFLLYSYENESAVRAKKFFAIITIIAVIAIIAVMASFASTYGASVEQSDAVVATFSSVWFYIRLGVGLILPVIAAVALYFTKKVNFGIVACALLAVIIGEIIGRALFYYSAMGQTPF